MNTEQIRFYSLLCTHLLNVKSSLDCFNIWYFVSRIHLLTIHLILFIMKYVTKKNIPFTEVYHFIGVYSVQNRAFCVIIFNFFHYVAAPVFHLNLIYGRCIGSKTITINCIWAFDGRIWWEFFKYVDQMKCKGINELKKPPVLNAFTQQGHSYYAMSFYFSFDMIFLIYSCNAKNVAHCRSL